jgi:GNAT superfamily N-acetyltransferase
MLIRPIELRDCEDLGLITVTASRSAFIGNVPEDTIDFSWTPAVSAANWKRDVWGADAGSDMRFFVAEDDGRVVGFVWDSPGADTPGFEWSVRALYVLPTRQGQGIGRMLLAHVCGILVSEGISSLEIGCVKENPNCAFYRHLGGAEVGRRPAAQDDYETEEILFGWRDLTRLLAGSNRSA